MFPALALLTGFLGGFVYFGASKMVLKVCKVDDPLDAFAVHGACGFWGVLATALFMDDKYDGGVNRDAGGLLTEGNADALAAALTQLICIIAWVGLWSVLMFFTLKKIGILRVSAEMEAAGMDVSKHGGSAYES